MASSTNHLQKVLPPFSSKEKWQTNCFKKKKNPQLEKVFLVLSYNSLRQARRGRQKWKVVQTLSNFVIIK